MKLPEFVCYYVGPTEVEIRTPYKSDKAIYTMRVSDIGMPYYDDLLAASVLLCDHFNLALMNRIRQKSSEAYSSKVVYV